MHNDTGTAELFAEMAVRNVPDAIDYRERRSIV